MRRIRLVTKSGRALSLIFSLCFLLQSAHGSDVAGGPGGWFGRVTSVKKPEREFANKEGESNVRDAALLETLTETMNHRNISNPFADSVPLPPPPPPPPTLQENTQVATKLDYDQENYIQDPSQDTLETIQNHQQPTLLQNQAPTFPYHPAWGQINAPPPLPTYNPWDRTYGQSQILAPNPYPDWNPTNYDVSQWRRFDQDKIQTLESQLNGALHHQSHLYTEIQNLTDNISELQRTTDLQLNQIHALTDRVEDAEQYAIAESNRALEYETNCTNLQATVTNLSCRLEQSQLVCSNLTLDLERQRQDMALLEQKLQRKDVELEDLAMGIERARVQRQVGEKRKLWEESKLKKKLIV